jgi:hypothetical protein
MSHREVTIQVHKYMNHRTTICSIVLRYEGVLEGWGYWKNRSAMCFHRTTMSRSVEWWSGLMRHRTTIYQHRSTILAWHNFFYKSQNVLFAKGSEFFYREKRELESEALSQRWETIKTHSQSSIKCNGSFFFICYLCFSHE